MKLHKKGSLNGLKEGVMALVLIALIAAAVAIALNEFRDDMVSSIDSTRVNNETFTWTNGSYTALANACPVAITCIEVRNASDTQNVIGAGNYTCAASLGINVTNFANHTDLQLNVSYECTDGDFQYNVTSEGLEGTANATDYLSTIGTLLGVAALIAVVVGAFFFIRK